LGEGEAEWDKQGCSAASTFMKNFLFLPACGKQKTKRKNMVIDS